MKKFLLIFIFFNSAPILAADVIYPWKLGIFAGGSSFCDDEGCFSPAGYATGASFGRRFAGRWSFELDGSFLRSEEELAARFDLVTGRLFVPQLRRSRFYAGGTFLGTLIRFGKESDLFLSIGFVAAVERQTELTPPGALHAPQVDVGIKGGVSGGAGINIWFSEKWAARPEIRFVAVTSSLSSLRYTAGIVRKF